MRRLLTTLLILAVIVAGLGYYRGWFGVVTDGSGPNRSITFTMDEDKIKADEQKARDQISNIGSTTPAEPKKD